MELRAMEEGKEEGKKEGQEEGKEEVALNLLRMGLPIEQVSEATGLSLDKIQQLQSQLDQG
jgi:predicted transposase/invertase (TIGR01784 family)